MSTWSTSSTNPQQGSPPTSTGGSTMPYVERVALVSHARDVDEAVEAVRAISARLVLEIVDEDDADLAVVLGGDGTMLRALTRFIATGVPVIGVNFGRIGYLTSIAADALEAGLERVFGGEYRTIELATLEVEVNGATKAAVNDVVVAGGTLG